MDAKTIVEIVLICLALVIVLQSVAGAAARHIRQNRRKRSKNQDAEETKAKIKTMDLILVLMGIFLLVFIVAMVVVFINCGAVPDSLVTGVFLLCGGECGVMGWIKNSKERAELRKWELEDRSTLDEGGNDFDK